jgi:hypothetical protein
VFGGEAARERCARSPFRSRSRLKGRNLAVATSRSRLERGADVRTERAPGLERAMGIEPTLSAWKAEVLPLNYARTLRREAQPLRRKTQREPAGVDPKARETGREEQAGREWWGEADSNRRRCYHQIYSLAHLAALEPPRGSSAVPAPPRVRMAHAKAPERGERAERDQAARKESRRRAKLARPLELANVAVRGGFSRSTSGQTRAVFSADDAANRSVRAKPSAAVARSFELSRRRGPAPPQVAASLGMRGSIAAALGGPLPCHLGCRVSSEQPDADVGEPSAAELTLEGGT